MKRTAHNLQRQLDVKITGKTIVDFALALEQIVDRIGQGELAGKAAMGRSTSYSFALHPLQRTIPRQKQTRGGKP